MPPAAIRRQARSQARRASIVEAALACFVAHGYAAAPVPEIGRRAAASIGSLYHQFGSKEGIAAAVYLEGLERYQHGLVEALGGISAARAGVLAIVRHHLHWVRDNATWARFLLEARRAEFMRGREEEIRRLNREFAGSLGKWFRAHVEAGRIRALPPDLLLALLLGPCHEYTRGLLGGRSVSPAAQAERLLGDSIWRALSAKEP